MKEKNINKHQVSSTLGYARLNYLNHLLTQEHSGTTILTLGCITDVCPMKDWHNLLNSEQVGLSDFVENQPNHSSRWFSSEVYFKVVQLRDDIIINLDNNLIWAANKSLINQVQTIYPDYPVKYAIPGPLTYLWFNEYLGQSKMLTSEKIAYLPSLIKNYKVIIQELKKCDISWVQLDDPIFISDILPEHQERITQAYQDLLLDAPKMMLATYFGGIDENINWIKNIPFEGLHIDLDSAPEQIMFVLKNDLMKSLKVLSLGGIKETDAYFHAIQDYAASITDFNPEVWLALSKKNIPQKTNLNTNTDIIDVIDLYISTKSGCPNKYPAILALKDEIDKLKQKNASINLSMESLSELTCFMKKRDQLDFIKNIKLLSDIK